ncbi:MAG: zinc ribbon domain-containing protein [Hydrogeniiclostridium mannosilyticum]
MAVINRKNAEGEDCLYFVCRTYQRFTKAGVCTCHSIKEETVNEAVISKIQTYIGVFECGVSQPIAERVLKKL